ncbi:MAG: hypothetical protein JST23_08150 [Bacteroidetes bacterium]|nr:hypothetical protein [Bacteroidota bacterium]
MNPQINKLVKSIFEKESLDECTIQELQQYAERHPYFGAAQLLLTKKMQLVQHQNYNEQLQKTFLYFNNPLWVEHLLNETGKATITKPESTLVEVPTTPENIVTTVQNFDTDSTPPTLQEKETTIAAVVDKTTTKNDELIFEPYHTVDYFASQGIKIIDEVKADDKFGKQLKSFTEWLKTMKRLPVTEITQKPITPSEHKVEELAEHSLENKEIVTETMAEVWEKQGNYQNAIEIYQKLSLLEPHKSAYFATLIEDLKKK